MPDNPLPYVSVIIATRNEGAFIEKNIRSIVANDYPGDRLEIVVVDGMSSDGTAETVRRLGEQDGRIRLVENPQKITPVAFNLGVTHSRGDIVFILGGHATITETFLRQCVQTLQEQKEAWCVGGSIKTISENFTGQAISAAMSSPIGIGNARFRLGNYKGFVDATSFCCYWRWVFDRIGMFDEELVRNQDDELNLRLLQAGGKIYMNGDIVSYYYSRGSLRKLARQYFQYGFWRIRTIQKHRKPATLRQIAPVVFVGVWLALLVGAAIWRPTLYGLGALGCLYVLGLLAGAVDVARKSSIRHALLAPVIFAILHFCYGLGGFKGIWVFLILHRGGKIDHAAEKLSR